MAYVLPIIVLGLMWVVLILPQQRRVKAHEAFVASVSVGDEVVTTSGIHGTVIELDGQTARLRIAPGVDITIARLALGQAVPVLDPPVPTDGDVADDAAIDDRSE